MKVGKCPASAVYLAPGQYCLVYLQAMDRCHRIGQTKPVLVFRLATSNSVEGKMLRRAGDKMALERLVIKKGVFKEVLDTSDTVVGEQATADQ